MNELKAARAVAEHWRRRYQAAQALIAELQGERDELAAGIHRRDARIAELTAEYNELLSKFTKQATDNLHGYGDAPVIRSHQHQPGAGLLGDNIVDEGRYIRRDDGSFFWWSDYKREETQHAPGAGLLGPYTPTPDPIQGVEDGWWIGCESWETWDGDE